MVASFHLDGTIPWRTDALNIAHTGPASRAGMMVASFHLDGTIPWRTDALNIAHTGPASRAQKSRRIQFDRYNAIDYKFLFS